MVIDWRVLSTFCQREETLGSRSSSRLIAASQSMRRYRRSFRFALGLASQRANFSRRPPVSARHDRSEPIAGLDPSTASRPR
jgi:hypothetical protein